VLKNSPVALIVVTKSVDVDVEETEIKQILDVIEPFQVFIKASGYKIGNVADRIEN